MMKRGFDVLFSFLALVILIPLFIAISLLVVMGSEGSAFYFQKRVGRNGKDFTLIKFRTMLKKSDSIGLLTIGENDSRITKTGRWLRKYKLDELPQLVNIFLGDMSIVGPRPEVRKYVDLYSPEQLTVLSVRPGLTDYASLEYINENNLLSSFSYPERAYIEKIMPDKLMLNLKYIKEQGFMKDLKIIFRTISRIF
jgi:lipopolysaccharide/colanic/teichoic acid biosynthesis glycosyltransferase